MNRFRQGMQAAAPRHTGRRPAASPLLSMLFFPTAIFYQELLLRLFDRDTGFFGFALARVALFSLAAGLCLFLILDLLPWRTAARIAGGVVLGIGTVLLCVERGCRSKFGLYYGLGFMGNMAADVTGDFGGDVLEVALSLIPFLLLSLVPVVLYILFRQTVIRERGQEPSARIILAVALVLFQLTGWALSAFGGVSGYYTYDYTANVAIPHFGLLTSIRLELEYAVVGQPVHSGNFIDDPVWTPPPATAGIGPTADPTVDPSADPSADPTPTPTPIPSGPNALDIDFAALAEGETNKTLKGMHEYFATLIPSEKNQYTGIFEGKNLILLTAEGFSPYAIDKELTPTLYRLTHEEGFVFNNFYQPDWTMSTTGGEFSVTTGLIPTWVSGKTAPAFSISRSMPLTLAHLFAAEGYIVPAWHNHTYTYYSRDQYLGNFGYDYHGVGSGLELPHNVWPNSDLEMMEATVDSYINNYVENGTPFHAYYMTESGHGGSTWAGNAMSRKHREEVEAKYPDLSEISQAYLACSMELDLALEYLVDKLEAAGIADDTLIVMAADHYPYLMTQDQPEDYYNELRGFEDTEKDTSRYRNTLLMWSGRFKEPIVVDTPCHTPDIVPTICNLFGLKYDSRLYSGRDIFATNYEANQYSNCMPLVVFANNKGQGNSWITAAGTYEASTGTFTPNEGVVLEDQADYVARVKRLVAAKLNYAKLILQEDYYKVLFPDGTVQ